MKKLKAENTFYKIQTTLYRAEKIIYVNSDGEEVCDAFSSTNKMIYVYMLDQYTRLKAINLDFYQSQDLIALECGVSVITVKRAIKFMEGVGLLVVKRDFKEYKKKNTYTVIPVTAMKYVKLYSKLLEENDPDTKGIVFQTSGSPTDIPVVEETSCGTDISIYSEYDTIIQQNSKDLYDNDYYVSY